MMISFIRTVITFSVLFFAMRIMGKRQLGELEPIELTVAILISNLASQPLADTGTPLLYGLIPVLTLLCLQVIITLISARSIRLRRILGGNPSIIIENGRIDQNELKSSRVSLDELFQELRGQGYTDVSEIKRAVLETDGSLSIIPFDRYAPATPDALGIQVEEKKLATAVISDGRLLSSNLKSLGLNEKWLYSELRKSGISKPKDVFLMTVDADNKASVIKKETGK